MTETKKVLLGLIRKELGGIQLNYALHYCQRFVEEGIITVKDLEQLREAGYLR
ncbi:MAG: hypothetical protein ABII71_05310 [Candidatus Micrarchaeota archaeon]